MDPLSDLELVALAWAVPAKRLTEAKAALSDGSSADVDMTVRIRGNVQKGVGTPDSTSSTPARVSLTTTAVFCAVLRELKVGPDRLTRILTEIDHDVAADPRLAGVFDAVAAEKSKGLDPIVSTTSGRSGAIRAAIEVTRI